MMTIPTTPTAGIDPSNDEHVMRVNPPQRNFDDIKLPPYKFKNRINECSYSSDEYNP